MDGIAQFLPNSVKIVWGRTPRPPFNRLPDVWALCHFGLQTFRPFQPSDVSALDVSPDVSALIRPYKNYDLFWPSILFKAPFTIGARPLYNTLRSKYFSFARPVAYVARSLAFVASVLVVASSRIRIVDMHTIQMRPNAIKIIAMQRTTIRTNTVQRFVCSHEWCTIFKGCKTSRSCLCVCCATMRLLLNMLNIIVQRFTIIARFISFNLPCCATSMYTRL